MIPSCNHRSSARFAPTLSSILLLSMGSTLPSLAATSKHFGFAAPQQGGESVAALLAAARTADPILCEVAARTIDFQNYT